VVTGKTIVRLEYPGRVAFEETIDIKGGSMRNFISDGATVHFFLFGKASSGLKPWQM